MCGIVVMMVLESTTPCSGVMVFQHRSCLAIPPGGILVISVGSLGGVWKGGEGTRLTIVRRYLQRCHVSNNATAAAAVAAEDILLKFRDLNSSASVMFTLELETRRSSATSIGQCRVQSGSVC